MHLLFKTTANAQFSTDSLSALIECGKAFAYGEDIAVIDRQEIIDRSNGGEDLPEDVKKVIEATEGKDCTYLVLHC